MEPPPPLKPPSKSRVSPQTIEKAVKSLLKWHFKKSQNNNKENNDFLYLVLTVNQIPPKGRSFSHRIPLPHPLFSPSNPSFRICLLVEDRYSLSSKQKIEGEGIPINNVIKLSKFKKQFKSLEDKTKLIDSYDVFFADHRVVPRLPGVIGKEFYRRKKSPVAIELGKSNWGEQIEEYCKTVEARIEKGSCCAVRVARAGMGRREIVENVAAVVDGAAAEVPKRWRNVRAVHLKFPESIAIPIYPEVEGAGGIEQAVAGMAVESGERRESGNGDGAVGKKRKRVAEKKSKEEQGAGTVYYM